MNMYKRKYYKLTTLKKNYTLFSISVLERNFTYNVAYECPEHKQIRKKKQKYKMVKNM